MELQFYDADKLGTSCMAALLSDECKLEILRMGEGPVEQVLARTIDNSVEARTAFWGNEFLCVFGIVQMLDGTACPWMVRTGNLARHKKILLRQSRLQVQQWRRQYPFLTNYVDARYGGAIRWLRWLGFDLGPEEMIGLNNAPFRRVTMTGVEEE